MPAFQALRLSIIVLLLPSSVQAWVALFQKRQPGIAPARKTITISSPASLSRAKPPLSSSARYESLDDVKTPSIPTISDSTLAFDAAVRNRFACKRFQRFDGKGPHQTTPSTADPFVLKKVMESLSIARLSPSSYNSQPYKVVVVQSPKQKLAMSKYCLGPNKQRILDSDCTVVFLADTQVWRTLPRHREMLKQTVKTPNLKLLNYLQFQLAIFSSGYPLPRFVSAFLSFWFRTAMSFFNIFSSLFFKYPLPSLMSAEAWASKHASMVAMTYMLACSARGLATLPMEGIQARGIRRVLGVPSRYSIPLIISTGYPYEEGATVTPGGERSKLPAKKGESPRYSLEEIIYSDTFGQSLQPALSSS